MKHCDGIFQPTQRSFHSCNLHKLSIEEREHVQCFLGGPAGMTKPFKILWWKMPGLGKFKFICSFTWNAHFISLLLSQYDIANRPQFPSIYRLDEAYIKKGFMCFAAIHVVMYLCKALTVLCQGLWCISGILAMVVPIKPILFEFSWSWAKYIDY